ncbi:MAG TPA: helix-turn-helix transcriptional regulator [Pseudonocardiaceae bacterium]|nr:helix-turn-helix transcriptional regulator [Pseudonocardiaceae bacterium]
MPVTNNAMTPRAKALAAALRQARDNTGVAGREIARRLGVSHAAVSHWETGKRVPRLEDVASLLAVLGVTGDDRERILELARHAADPDWLTVGIPGVVQQLAGVMECERTAKFIAEWSPWVIPGLLQSSDYARAIIGAGGVSPADVEARLIVRLGRRDVLSRRDLDELVVLIGEPAIRQEIGGPAVMAEQLRYLLRLAGSGITMQVVPIGKGWHPGLAGPFIFYRFADSPSIVHIEHHRSSAFVFDDNDVAGYADAVATVRGAALNPTESAVLINEVIAALETT